VDENTFQLSPATAIPTLGVTASGSYTAGSNGRFTGSLTEPSSFNGVFYVLNNKGVNNSSDNILTQVTGTE
jgi:hypothetical protein